MSSNLFLLIEVNSIHSKNNLDNKLGIFRNFEEFVGNLLPIPNEITSINCNVSIDVKFSLNTVGIKIDDYILNDFYQEIKDNFDAEIKFVEINTIEEIFQSLNFENNELNKILCNFSNKNENYSININEKYIILQAAERQGLFYAIQTFLQILEQSIIKGNEFILPGMDILDYPTLKIRGIADEITRGQVPTVESVKRYIHIISKYKMNAYAIGYEQNFFKFKKYPVDPDYMATLNAEEIHEIDEYAKKRFVELFPIYTTFGHQDNLLQLPEYKDWGEFVGSQCYNITDERIHGMMESHISELSDAFSSKTFHMGSDESWDLGFFKSERYIDEMGPGNALLKHYLKIYDVLKKYGMKKIIIYHDIVFKYKEELKKAPKDLHLMYWEYNPKKKYPPVDEMINTGLPVIISPSHLNWTRHFPDYINSSKNIISLIEYSKNANRDKPSNVPGVIGQLNSTWNDFTNHNLRENNIYGTILSGAVSWTEKSIDAKNFLSSYAFHFFGIRNINLMNSLKDLIWDTANLIRYFRNTLVMLPQVFFTHLYRHPFYSKKPIFLVKKYDKLISECNQLLKNLDIILPHITKNHKFLEYIKYSIEIVLLLGEKEKMKDEISLILKKIKITEVKEKQVLKQQSIKIIENFIIKAENLMSNYETLWLHCAKRPVLDFHLGRFRNMIRYCKEKIDQIDSEIYFKNPFLKSEWLISNNFILPPGATFYRKVFQLKFKPKKAKLLAMAGDRCIIFVNGKQVGDVVSRVSLSFVPIKKRLQVYEVAEYLNEGSNLIAVESFNYQKIKSTFNLLLRYEISEDNETIIKDIPSDNSWITFEGYDRNNPDLSIRKPVNLIAVSDDWNSNSSNDYIKKQKNWKKAKSLGAPPAYNLHIYDEDLLNNTIPYTEEYYGTISSIYADITNGISPKAIILLKPLIPFIIKLLKLK